MKIQYINYLLILTGLSGLLLQGCGNSGTNGANGGQNAPAAAIAATEPPFNNKEPETYQTEIWQVSSAGTEKYFVVRDGAKWRIDSAYGSPEQVSTFHTAKDYVVSHATKTFTEYPSAHGFDEREGMVSEMTLGMLNIRDKAAFEPLGTENGLLKYKVTSEAAVNVESIVYVDEKLGLPVKKEVFKTDGGQRVLDRKVELSGFTTTIDKGLLEMPKGLKQASIEEMKKTLSGIK